MQLGIFLISLTTYVHSVSFKKMSSDLILIEDPPSNPRTIIDAIISMEKAEGRIVTMCLASINEAYTVLNRTVVVRGLTDKGILFVTERNSQKYKDLQINPKVAATLLFFNTKDEEQITKQIRINGTAIEVPEAKLVELWNEEELHAKIRSKICECGKPIDWNILKLKHDELLKAVNEGKVSLDQKTDTYTAFEILFETVDYYYSKTGRIADRIVYRKTNDDNNWRLQHVCA